MLKIIGSRAVEEIFLLKHINQRSICFFFPADVYKTLPVSQEASVDNSEIQHPAVADRKSDGNIFKKPFVLFKNGPRVIF